MDEFNLYKKAIHLFINTTRMHRKSVENIVSKLGCKHTQHRILLYLNDNLDAPSQKQIAKFFNISPAAAAVTLKKMEKSGLIERTVWEDDNRVHQINMTEYGKQIIQATRQIFKSLDLATFEGFNQAELESFMNYLERMQNNIQKLDIERIVVKGRKAIETI